MYGPHRERSPSFSMMDPYLSYLSLPGIPFISGKCRPLPMETELTVASDYPGNPSQLQG